MPVSLCALGVGGRLREELDVRILRSHESPALLEMWNRWFSVGHGQTPTTVLQLEVVGPAMGLLCTYGLLQIFNLLGQRIVKRGGSKAMVGASPTAETSSGKARIEHGDA